MELNSPLKYFAFWILKSKIVGILDFGFIGGTKQGLDRFPVRALLDPADYIPLFIDLNCIVCCAYIWNMQAKAETVSKVMDIVKQQLALAADVGLTAESKFADLGADSLDTVEIVMALEEEFKITVEEDNAQNITTIQEAADLIDKLVDQNPAAPAA